MQNEKCLPHHHCKDKDPSIVCRDFSDKMGIPSSHPLQASGPWYRWKKSTNFLDVKGKLV